MIEILECTLRDASYPISYQFTAEDTALIAAGLYQAGFKRIEIGHGLGLRASGVKYGFAAASDEEYLAAAATVVPKGIIGFFAIPGIAELEDIDLLTKYGAGFVRIGTDVNKTNEARDFIKKAKDLGLEVSANLMKTYICSPEEVAERSLQLQEWGADIIAVIDSAGGMLPDSVKGYVSKLVKSGINKVGFHGHNNIQLALANTLAAVEAGATIVDSTLRGLGRSSGNAQTEALVMCLEKMGYNTGVDIYQTLDISEKIIAPIARGRGSDNIELVSGHSLFHSGYLPLVEKIAAHQEVDTRKLIMAVGDGGGKEINEASISAKAQELKQNVPSDGLNNNIKEAIARFQKKFMSEKYFESNISSLLSDMNVLAKKSGKTSALTITLTQEDKTETNAIPFIRVSNNLIIGNIELIVSEVEEVLKKADGLVDYLLLDDSLASRFSNIALTNTPIIQYSENNAYINAVNAYIDSLGSSTDKTFVICGITYVSSIIAEHLLSRGMTIVILDNESQKVQQKNSSLRMRISNFNEANDSIKKLHEVEQIDGVIGFTSSSVATKDLVSKFHKKTFIVDVYVGSFPDDFLRQVHSLHLPVYRIDMRAGLAAEVILRLETRNLINNVFGKVFYDGVAVVAGGLIGDVGTVVLDSLSNPSKVLGIADGKGGLLPLSQQSSYSDVISQVNHNLLLNKLPY